MIFAKTLQEIAAEVKGLESILTDAVMPDGIANIIDLSEKHYNGRFVMWWNATAPPFILFRENTNMAATIVGDFCQECRQPKKYCVCKPADK